MRSFLRLSKAQQDAMGYLYETEPTPGVLTAGKSGVYDKQAEINWKTAYALHHRGVVVVKPYGEAAAYIYLEANASTREETR